MRRWRAEDAEQLRACIDRCRLGIDAKKSKRTTLFVKCNDLLVNEVVVIPQVDRKGAEAFANEIKNSQLTAWNEIT